MGTWTAQILVGSDHPYHGGIVAHHQLFLSENSKPAWICYPMELAGEGTRNKICWIPSSVPNILKDGLLMIALHCGSSNKIARKAREFSKKIMDEEVFLHKILTDEQVAELHQMVRDQGGGPKLVISVFEESTLAGQLEELKDHGFHLEVCRTTFIRGYSPFNQESYGGGDLEEDSPVTKGAMYYEAMNSQEST
jgi:hypothetical protein